MYKWKNCVNNKMVNDLCRDIAADTHAFILIKQYEVAHTVFN